MNALLRHIRAIIRDQGPVSLATYMGLTLGHPELGYYQRQSPFGAAGDFITAPEISQMFGELIGLWCVQRWRDMGSPSLFMLCELGPGRGTMMADALRAARVAPDFLNAAQLHLVETSRALRETQKAAIGRAVTWHDHVADLPPLPAIFIANEFFDALPIRQFQRLPGGWHERMVTIDPDTDQLCFTLSPVALGDDTVFAPALRAAAAGAIAELCPAGLAIIESLAAHICACGGAGLIIDYGPEKTAPGDSFQAVRGHSFCDPLQNPGEADLTAHVDFQSLAATAQRAGCLTDGPLPQGRFLLQLGLAMLAQRLAQNASPAEQDAIHSAFQRLTATDQMGHLFKALALRHPVLAVSPGFEACIHD